MTDDVPYWERLSLAEMNDEEFEALCDRCARCCLHKLEDEDSGEIAYTDVACRLLDRDTCLCSDYARRTERVPGCVSMAPDRLAPLRWLPVSCAYRRLAEGRGLAWWHPLVSGDPDSVHLAGVSMRGRCISEQRIDPDDIDRRIDADIEWRPLRRR